MARRLQLVMASALLALSANWTSARAAEDTLPTCPITGETISFDQSTMTEEGPVFFCCKKCIAGFEKNPAKFAAAVAKQRKALAKRDRVQVTCPVSGEAVKAGFSVEHDGTKVSFCCNHCASKFKASPDKFKTMLAASYTYQTKCPITGEDITPGGVSVLPSGAHVYTCCKRCAGKLGANAEAVVASLAAQGYNFSEEEIKKSKLVEDED